MWINIPDHIIVDGMAWPGLGAVLRDVGIQAVAVNDLRVSDTAAHPELKGEHSYIQGANQGTIADATYDVEGDVSSAFEAWDLVPVRVTSQLAVLVPAALSLKSADSTSRSRWHFRCRLSLISDTEMLETESQRWMVNLIVDEIYLSRTDAGARINRRVSDLELFNTYEAGHVWDEVTIRARILSRANS